MGEQHMTLSTFMLGPAPYVVLECQPDDDPENAAGFTMRVNAGGGVESRDQVAVLLLLAVEEITGVSTDLYTQEVDAVRRAAGLAPLADSMVDPGEVSHG